MGRMRSAARSIKEQVARVAEKTPRITLVPSEHDAAEQHAKADDTTCAAIASFQGEFVECEQPKGHAGNHTGAGRTWRPRSGDE